MILTEQREERFLKSKNAKSFFQHLCLFQNTPGRTELGMPTKQPAAMLQSRLVKLIKLSFHQSLCKFSNVSNSAGVICKRWHWREWGGEDCFQLWQRALRLSIQVNYSFQGTFYCPNSLSIQVQVIIILFTELTACSSMYCQLSYNFLFCFFEAFCPRGVRKAADLTKPIDKRVYKVKAISSRTRQLPFHVVHSPLFTSLLTKLY